MLEALCFYTLSILPGALFPSLLLFLKKLFLFIYFWLRWAFAAARGLFSSCREWGLLFVVVHGLLIAVASLVAEHRL